MLIFCRLCAKLKNQKELKTTIDDPVLRIREKLILCCQWNTLTNDDDTLPQNVCTICVDKLEQSWNFAKSVASAENVLRNVFYPKVSTTDVLYKAESICVNEADQPDTMHFVAVKLESESANDFVGNQSNCNEIGSKPTIIYDDDLFNATINQKFPNTIGHYRIDNFPSAHKFDMKSCETDFLSVLLKEDRNDDGTIKDEGMAKLRVSRWSDYEFKCWKCKLILKGVDKFRTHIESNHPNEPPPFQYICSDCSKIYSKYWPFLTHVRTAHKPHLKYCCDICSNYFWNLDSLKIHVRKHSKESRSFECSTCHKRFSRKCILAVHSRLHLPAESKHENLFVCDICKKTFALKTSLYTHMPSHMNHRPHTCEKCGKSFKTRATLKDHVLTHTDDRLFACDKCDKTFQTLKYLRYHQRFHNTERPHVCDTCGRTFRSKNYLHVHMRIHSGALPYVCKFCGKGFRSSSVYANHRRTHTGERPYYCTLRDCDRSFTKRTILVEHMKRIHGIDIRQKPRMTLEIMKIDADHQHHQPSSAVNTT